jgi:hypothetical protein
MPITKEKQMKKSVSMQILSALGLALALAALGGCAQDPQKIAAEDAAAKKEPVRPLVITGSRFALKDRSMSSVVETSDSMSRTMQTGVMSAGK